VTFFLTRLHTQCPTDILTMSIVDVLFAAESNDHVEFIEQCTSMREENAV